MSQTFAELGLNPERTAGLLALGYETPSRLQSEVIPQLLAGRDVVAVAAPGSGKTLSYVLPILQTLDPEAAGSQALVLVQSAEEALRVADLFQALNQDANLRIVPLFDEQPIAREVERLQIPATILVGTPTRVKEHAGRESLDLKELQFVLIDGASDLLVARHKETIESLLDMAPASRQTAFFTTRLDETLQELADQHLFEPVVITQEPGTVAIPLIKHRYQNIETGSKTRALVRLLDGENINRALIYVNLRPQTLEVAHALKALGYGAVALHGESEPEARDSALLSWREGSTDFLVVTDKAAADLVLETPYAISYDIATSAAVYGSRAKLVAENATKFTLVAPRERALLSEIENALALRVKAVLPPTRADAFTQRTETFKQRLRDIINKSNLEIYMMLLTDLAEEGYDWSEIASAAVSIIQHAQVEALFTRRAERRAPPPSPATGPAPRSPERREFRREREEDREVETGYVRLVMDAGYDIGVRPKDIVGAIANEANIPGRAVGNIDIRDRFTYVEVQEDFADRVLARVPTTRLRGRIVTFRRA